MKLALVTDAWLPQVNGVVTTMLELQRQLQAQGHEVLVVHPGDFRTRPCPGYPGIDLAVQPGPGLALRLDSFDPDAVHLATEGPLGWAARRHCLRRGLAFTTAFHTKFPEIAHAALRVPVGWGYALLRHFHRPSAGVLVPTRSVLDQLARRRFAHLRPWTHGVDLDLFPYRDRPGIFPGLEGLPRPLWLFVGRVSYEKNIQAFLRTPLPGSKVVCGVGPVREGLQRAHPGVHWIGLLERPVLARLYAAADVFVFPSHADTFGLVMVEAMASGTPVAAYPVDGPLEVLGRPAPGGGRPLGGVMDEDLGRACMRALGVPREEARLRAQDFSWAQAAQVFAQALVPARPGRPVPGAAAAGMEALVTARS